MINLNKIHFIAIVILGLLLQVIPGFVAALPLKQEIADELSSETESMTRESFLASEAPGKPGKSIMGDFEAERELQNLKEAIYPEVKKKRNTQQFYSSQNNDNKHASELKLLDEESTDLASLLEPLTSKSDIKDMAKGAMESIKDVKELLIINKKINYEDSEQEINLLIEKNMYKQEQQQNRAHKGIYNKVSKERYDASLFREFFSKVLTFVFYMALGIAFMKLVLMFIAWQRKNNRYKSVAIKKRRRRKRHAQGSRIRS